MSRFVFYLSFGFGGGETGCLLKSFDFFLGGLFFLFFFKEVCCEDDVDAGSKFKIEINITRFVEVMCYF